MTKTNLVMGGLMGALFLFIPMCILWLHEAQTLTGCALAGWSMIAAIVCIAKMMEAWDKPTKNDDKLPRNTRRRPEPE